jgi:hypothetical protein
MSTVSDLDPIFPPYEGLWLASDKVLGKRFCGGRLVDFESDECLI